MILPSAPPACPTCGAALAKRPAGTRKCPQCRAVIISRSYPGGGRALFRADELPAFEAELAAKAALDAGAALRWYYAAVAGESHQNPDGTSRQDIRRYALRGELVQMIPEPQNSYDRNAIKLCLGAVGYQVGYLTREKAAEVTRRLQAGWRYAAQIHRVSGGTAEKPTRGIVLRIVEAPPNILDADFDRGIKQAREAPDDSPDWDEE